MRRATITWRRALTLGAICGCRAEAPSQGPIVRDSAGIVVVEHDATPPPRAPAWTVEPVPTLDIGGSHGGDEPYLLSNVILASGLPGGEFLVADSRAAELRIFDSTGRFVRRISGKGSGPAEFQALSWVGVGAGGAITVFDASLRRLSRFSPTGQLQHLASLPLAGGGWVVGVFGDGSILMRRTRGLSEDPSKAPTGLVRDSLDLVVVSPDGTSSTVVGHALDSQKIRAVGRVVSQEPAPFGLRTVVAVADTVFYVSTQDTYDIRAYRKDGHLQRVVRWRLPSRLVDAAAKAEWQRQHARRLERIRGRSLPPAVLEVAQYDALPDAFPAHGELIVDRTGDLWVEDYRPFPREDTLVTWTVFAPDGAIRARAALPNVQVSEIGADRIVGVWRGLDDVPSVRVYRIVRQ